MEAKCDRCNQENPIANECNFCPQCRADFNNESAQRSKAMKEENDKFWNEYRNRY